MSFELFRLEAQTQLRVINEGMQMLGHSPGAVDRLEACAHASRRLKTAARIVGLWAGASLAEAMEHNFTAASRSCPELHPKQIEMILRGVDLFDRFAKLLAATEPACAGASPLPVVESLPEAFLSSPWRGGEQPISVVQACHEEASPRRPEEQARELLGSARRALAQSRRLTARVEHIVDCCEQLASAESEAPVRNDGADGSRKRVLVVDDSLEMRELKRKLLEFRGYEVQLAADGVDAWHALRTGDFHLVLTDTDMPLVDGLELTRRIRKDPHLQVLSVIVVCDQDCEVQRRRGFEAGADYYVVKGRLRDTLAQVVASLIGTAQA